MASSSSSTTLGNRTGKMGRKLGKRMDHGHLSLPKDKSSPSNKEGGQVNDHVPEQTEKDAIRRKKGKKFADRDFMMSIINEANMVQEKKFIELAEKESEMLKRLAQRAVRRTKEKRSEMVAKKKEQLRGQQGGSKGRGDRRFNQESQQKSKTTTMQKDKPKASGSEREGKRKKVTFK